MHLRVIEAFADHAIGDTITDAEEVAAILESHAVAFVVKFLPASRRRRLIPGTLHHR